MGLGPQESVDSLSEERRGFGLCFGCDSSKRIRNGHFPIGKRARIDIPLRDKRRITGGSASAWEDPQAGSVWDTHEFKENFPLSSRDSGVLSSIPTARTARFIRAKSYCHHWRFP